MKRPFVFLSASLLSGILTGYFFTIDGPSIVFLLILFTLVGFLIYRGKKTSLFIFPLVFFLGLLLMEVKVEPTIELYSSGEVEVEGEIVSVEKIEEDYASYILRSSRLKSEGQSTIVREKILFTSDSLGLELGDRIRVEASISLPRENRNPLLFNYKNYLLSKNIRVKAYGGKEAIVLLGKADQGSIYYKKRILDRLDQAFNGLTRPNKSFLTSLSLGKTSLMDQKDLEEFRGLGLAHILAVSGLHLGIVTGFLLALLALFGLDRRLANLICLVFILIYIYLVDFSPSIVRAGLMLIIFLLSINLKTYSDPINNLFFVSFILLVVNPYIIFSLSFQLSLAASLAVLIIPKKIKSLYMRSKCPLLDSLVVIIGVQLGLFPIQAYYFNHINILGIVANLLILPLVGLILPLGFLLFFLPAPFGLIKYSLSTILNSLINLVFYLKDQIYGLDILDFKLASPSILGIIFYYLTLLVLFRIIRIDFFPKRINNFILIFLLIIGAINLATYGRDEGLVVEFIDVDQGDCSLVRQGGYNYLIDTGGNSFKAFDIGKNIVLPYLEKTGVKKLDGVFISHFDADHCKSLPGLMDEIGIDKIFIGYRREENPYYREMVKKAEDLGIPIYILSRGDQLPLNQDLGLRVLAPEEDVDQSQGENDLSLVFRLDYKGEGIVFTGDIEGPAEARLVEGGLDQARFLKVAHHGSQTSSSQAFLDGLGPEKAFVQVGVDNSFGHPSPEVVQLYEDRSIDLYRTDELGCIKLWMGEKTYDIRGYMGEKYSIMDVIIKYKGHIFLSLLYILILGILIKSYIGNKELDSFEFW